MKTMMLVLVGLLLAAVCVADGDKPMLAKDGTPLPDGVARIVKWEASQFRQHKAYVALDSDKEVRRHVADLPKDGITYHIVQRQTSNYAIVAVGDDGQMVSYICHWPGGNTGITDHVVVIE